jgi:hypothetical protein
MGMRDWRFRGVEIMCGGCTLGLAALLRSHFCVFEQIPLTFGCSGILIKSVVAKDGLFCFVCRRDSDVDVVIFG